MRSVVILVLVILALGLASCGQAVTSIPTPSPILLTMDTPTPIPVPSPTPTAIPAPTPTATFTPGLPKEGPPPFPNVFLGKVFVGNKPAPEGVEVFARVNGYQTPLVLVGNGRYRQIVVGPPNVSFFGQEITFYALIGAEEVRAQETSVYREVTTQNTEYLVNTLDLHIP